MRASLRRNLIEKLLENHGRFITLSRICELVHANRKQVLRQMYHLTSQGAATVTKRYPREGKIGPRPQEVIYSTNYGKLQALLKASRMPGFSGRDRMWRVIRAARSFTRVDLCQLAGVTRGNANNFSKRLRDAGYIRQRTRGTWELIRDPGPERPA